MVGRRGGGWGDGGGDVVRGWRCCGEGVEIGGGCDGVVVRMAVAGTDWKRGKRRCVAGKDQSKEEEA